MPPLRNFSIFTETLISNSDDKFYFLILFSVIKLKLEQTFLKTLINANMIYFWGFSIMYSHLKRFYYIYIQTFEKRTLLENISIEYEPKCKALTAYLHGQHDLPFPSGITILQEFSKMNQSCKSKVVIMESCNILLFSVYINNDSSCWIIFRDKVTSSTQQYRSPLKKT